MITISVKDFNHISQDYYDSVINSLQLHQLTCSCGHSACLSIHAYYVRGIFLSNGILPLRVCRVICPECSRTHALLLSSIVPYSRISAADQHAAVAAYETSADPDHVCDANPSLDENNVKSVVRRYLRSWKQRLLSGNICLSDLSSLIKRCFAFYSMQFMQIRSAPNQLFSFTT